MYFGAGRVKANVKREKKGKNLILVKMRKERMLRGDKDLEHIELR